MSQLNRPDLYGVGQVIHIRVYYGYRLKLLHTGLGASSQLYASVRVSRMGDD